MIENGEGRPCQGGSPKKSSFARNDDTTVPNPIRCSRIAQQLRRRRAASWRLPALPDGRRDPLDPRIRLGARPSRFGLSQRELAAERARCRASGWQEWELYNRFEDPQGGDGS